MDFLSCLQFVEFQTVARIIMVFQVSKKIDLFPLMILQVSNILYVDQPTGTGFSYSSDRRDIRHDEKGVSNDLYDFLQVSFVLFFFPSSTLWSKHL